MTNTYAKAYTEILEILKYLPKEEYNRIPKKEIDFYKTNMDKNYDFKYNPLQTLKEQNLSKEANAIIVTIFRDYFASDKQKGKLNTILYNNEQRYQAQLREKYNPDDIFKERRQRKIDNNLEYNQETSLIVKEEKWYIRLYNHLRSFFRRNK